jgi:GINS complex subunit 4
MDDFDDILRDFEKDARPSRGPDTVAAKQEDVQQLTRAWIHERMAPELLPYEGELIERVLAGVRLQTELVEANSLEMSLEKDMNLRLLIVESELERVSFLVRSYLRARLSKIDQYAVFIRSNEEMVARLSQAETSYMETHLAALVELYNGAFLRALPHHLQALDDTGGGISMVDEPMMDRPVFIRVQRSLPEPLTVFVNDEDVELAAGGIYLLRYSAIKHLLPAPVVLI